MKWFVSSLTLPALTLGLLLVVVSHQTSAWVVQPEQNPYNQPSEQSQTMTLSNGDVQQSKADQKATKAAKKQDKQAARAAEREAKKQERQAARQERKDQTSAKKAAAKEARKAEREAKKAARQAAKQEGRSLASRTWIDVGNPQCLAAITDCSLFDAVESEMMPMWERTTLRAEVKAVYRERKDDLRRLKELINQLIDFTIQNPDSDQPLLSLCDGVGSGQGTTTANGGGGQGGSSGGGGSLPKPSGPSDSSFVPSNPSNPSGLSNPSDPFNPSDPSNPFNPSGPFIPLDPSNPADPSNPFNPSNPSNPFNPLNPSGPSNPSEPSNPLNPSDPSNPSNPNPSSTADPWTNPPNGVTPPSIPSDPWTGSNRHCVVSPWSEWSAPRGFGTQERTRYIVQPGGFCPEGTQLTEQRDIPSEKTQDGEYVVDDVGLVTNNFHEDFIRDSEGKPRDLLLVLDSSGSIMDDDFQALKDGVQVLIDSLCGGFGPAPSQHRMAIVQFSTFTKAVHSFADLQDPDSLKAAVNSTRPMYGYTCTGDALQQAFEEFDASRGARDYTVHDTLIITDGKSNCGRDLLTSSRTLQQRSNVYALAIGLSSDPAARGEITSLVSNRDPRHLFSLANFQDFKDMVTRVQTRHDANRCQAIDINN